MFAAVRSVLGAPPTTALVKAPPSIVATSKVSFKLTGEGATGFRARVDAGTWSAPQATPTVTVSLTSGRHTVQVQAVAANGFADPIGITRVVVVDKQGPQVKVRKIKRGRTTVLVARSRTAPGGSSRTRSAGRAASAARRVVAAARAAPPTVTVQDTSGASATTRVASALRS